MARTPEGTDTMNVDCPPMRQPPATREAKVLPISLGPLLAWTVAPALLLGAAGAYPTWRLAGTGGLVGLTAAACAVVAAMTGGAVVVVRRASGGLAKAVIAFLWAALVRIGTCLVLGLAAAFLLPLSPPAMLIWLAALYVVSLAGESVWLILVIRNSTKAPPPLAPGTPALLK